MSDFFNNQPVMEFFNENFKKTIEHLYQYYLSLKMDSSKIQRIYFSVSEDYTDFNKKVLTVFSWLSVHFETEDDRSKLFQRIDSSLKGHAIVENAPSSLPSVQISGKVEKVLKGSLDLIPPPSPSVKIQIMSGKVFKSLLTTPSNFLPYSLM